MKVDLAQIAVGVGLVWVVKKLLEVSYNKISELLPYRILKVRFSKFNIHEVIIESEIAITNKANLQLNIQGFNGSLFFKDLQISQISNFNNPFSLSNNETKVIKLYFGFQPGTLLTQISQLIASGKLFGNFRVSGQLIANEMTLPIDFTPDILPN